MNEPTPTSSPTADQLESTASNVPHDAENHGERSIDLVRTSQGAYTVTNRRGGTLNLGVGENSDFTPVELLLAAIAGCSAVDVDFLTSRRSEPEDFTVKAKADKMSSPTEGGFMENMHVEFTVRFGDGEGADKAREILPATITKSRDRLCTVSRTVARGTYIEMSEADGQD